MNFEGYEVIMSRKLTIEDQRKKEEMKEGKTTHNISKNWIKHFKTTKYSRCGSKYSKKNQKSSPKFLEILLCLKRNEGKNCFHLKMQLFQAVLR
ncbi:MAG: hypothetical protein Ta2E_01650 [Mycoplasmoidaceae bacterium]|nr:MAG: hypothetical protein Ta2E_01650 [Mycoplasmoidaceae bacterium]